MSNQLPDREEASFNEQETLFQEKREVPNESSAQRSTIKNKKDNSHVNGKARTYDWNNSKICSKILILGVVVIIVVLISLYLHSAIQKYSSKLSALEIQLLEEKENQKKQHQVDRQSQQQLKAGLKKQIDQYREKIQLMNQQNKQKLVSQTKHKMSDQSINQQNRLEKQRQEESAALSNDQENRNKISNVKNMINQEQQYSNSTQSKTSDNLQPIQFTNGPNQEKIKSSSQSEIQEIKKQIEHQLEWQKQFFFSKETQLEDEKQAIQNQRPFALLEGGRESHDLKSNHFHSNFSFKYPTVGISTPGRFFNSTPVKREDLAKFDQALIDLFKPYNDTDCQIVRVGSQDDGGYLLCKNFLSQAEALLNFGVQRNDDFGCEISKKQMIPNFQYDCTVEKAPYCYASNNADVFSKICLGQKSQKTEKYTFYSLWDVLKSRSLVRKHVIVKMDVEGGQYPAFKYFPLEFLDYIDQLVLQVHLDEIAPQIWGNLDIFTNLADKFVSINLHMNNFACFYQFKERQPFRRMKARAFEVTLVNKKLITLNSASRSFKQHPLNAIDYRDEKMEDCQFEEP